MHNAQRKLQLSKVFKNGPSKICGRKAFIKDTIPLKIHQRLRIICPKFKALFLEATSHPILSKIENSTKNKVFTVSVFK